jgi:hypothetical protein
MARPASAPARNKHTPIAALVPPPAVRNRTGKHGRIPQNYYSTGSSAATARSPLLMEFRDLGGPKGEPTGWAWKSFGGHDHIRQFFHFRVRRFHPSMALCLGSAK